MLEIPRRNRTAGPFRRVAKIMAELGWTAVRVRELTRGGYNEQVSWLLSRYANRRPPCTAEELETPARTALFAKLVLMAQLVPSRLQNADGRRQASNTGVTEFILLLRLYLLRDNQFKPFGCRPPCALLCSCCARPRSAAHSKENKVIQISAIEIRRGHVKFVATPAA